ncbi:MAG: tRNA uridine-5-carboxymethylaminomethyl(34) synthesis enzyme MnmG [Fimbriimonadaceae bacterium]|nr:tRNA uridine-5-carboxymethylaminomethyl(34) synthesis enzyme MnmG [Fimbriimonadaceae bacterium]
MRAYDVVVVGAGHAGIEAAAAAARLGARTLCVTLRLENIGHLPCNCSIGGPGKGQIVREVDALGGVMALAADHTTTHTRRVGTGKGPANQTIRAQVCKVAYPLWVRSFLERIPGLEVRQGEASSVLLDHGRVAGIVLDGERIAARAVVLTTGTFLNGVCHEGANSVSAARHGDAPCTDLASWLVSEGFRLRRFKTGTTPRIHRDSVHWDEIEELPSEPEAGPISFLLDALPESVGNLPAYRTHTNEATHAILRSNLSASAMFSGRIEGTGPRFCPSVEDKVVRFASKASHPVFLELEEMNGPSVYVQGFSTSMPAEVQLEALQTIPGLARAEVLRYGYAVEYDSLDPLHLDPCLMAKDVPGLYFAGQLNGTSGYEEAAGQGLLAGANAALASLGKGSFELSRSSSYIGVMVDDLVTKGAEDPYRMLTGRAEHRLVLRHDNADQRLTPIAIELGLVCGARKARLEEKVRKLAKAKEWALNTHLLESTAESEVPASLSVTGRAAVWSLLRRPGVGPAEIASVAERLGWAQAVPWSDPVWNLLEVEAKFEGYLQREEREIAKLARLETMRIPGTLDYARIGGLSHESREKLAEVRPTSVGQAGRIPGMRPTDIALLVGHVRLMG